jgi:endonuclease YncB( thermonuclease family)
MKNHLAIALAAVFVAAPLEAQTLTGPATVIDGDTIDMTGTRIRLIGIDASSRVPMTASWRGRSAPLLRPPPKLHPGAKQ